MAGTRGRHRVKRQEVLLTGGAREGGDGRAEGSPAIDGGQAAATHAWRWWHSFWFLVDSTLFTLWKKQSSDVLVVALFFPFLHHRWHGSCWIARSNGLAVAVLFLLVPCFQKANRASWNKENPYHLPMPWILPWFFSCSSSCCSTPSIIFTLFPLLSLGTS